MGTLKESFKNVNENLGVVSTPLKCFQSDFGTNEVGHEERRSWWFYKKALVFLCSRSEQLTRATTLPLYGTGPSLKFVCFSAGSLILYKGSWYLENMVRATPESGLSPRMGQYISRHIPSRRKTLGFSRRGAGVMLWRRYCRGMPGR
jgi:hypothetical protein